MTAAARFEVLGVPVDAVQIPEVIDRMASWIRRREACRYVTVTGMHGVTEARRDPSLRAVFRGAGMVVPDGMPLVWLGRLKGHGLRRRVYGPELMLEFCSATAREGFRHFFYGGAPGVAEDLAARMSARCPGLVVAGTHTPPFRPLLAPEAAAVREKINASGADIVWVGLSTPTQERWMADNGPGLKAPVLVGVGAAFDFHTGRVPQAPAWMRESGLEWLYRLCREPRRLWRRYLLRGPEFIWNVSLELMKLRQHD